MRNSRSIALRALACAALAGCDHGPSGSHGDYGHDAGSPDASYPDAAGPDAQVPDGGAPDGVVHRRSVAVIVDFANASLEDWTGPGFNTVAEVQAQLTQMDQHWAFLSRGHDLMQWDLIRIRLPQPLTETAYPDFNAFRDAAVTLAKQQLVVADFDHDGDGIIDTMWLVASDNGIRLPYLVGGTSQNAGANNFGDGQDSDSVVGGHTGNFNHEVGHTLGLVDIYGTRDTIQFLTVMSDSWPLPPNDFTAFDRLKLGWIVPHVVAQTTADVELADTTTTDPTAIRIPTGRADEYFLIEYRRRPATGFGSSPAVPFDGLAVYHVFEGSNQDLDPPLLKLEPADGTTAASLTPALTDFAYPGNPDMPCPLVLRTYFGGDPVFQLDNLRFTSAGAIAFDLTILSAGIGSAPNLVANSTFETGTQGWITGGYMPEDAVFELAAIGANSSQRSVSITAANPNDVEWSTQVTGVPAEDNVYMCGFIRGQGVTGGAGGSISISGTFIQTGGLHGTFDFTRACAVVTPPNPGTALPVACRLGGFAATTSGQIWCDDISVYPLNHVFDPAGGILPPPFE